jgi:hypothetical protein
VHPKLVCLSLALAGYTLGAAHLNAQGPLHNFQVTWSIGADTGRIDRGIGIAFFANPPGHGTPLADTMLVRARPTSLARITGAFLYQETRRGIAWRYGAAAPRRLRPNVVEYGYEEAGVPIDSLTAGGKWARVILGFDTEDRSYLGWVALDSARVRHLLWKRVLAGNRVFFLPHEPPRFFDQPGGKEVRSVWSLETTAITSCTHWRHGDPGCGFESPNRQTSVAAPTMARYATRSRGSDI